MPFVDLKKGHHITQSIESTRPEMIIHGKSKVIRINHAAYRLLGEPKRVRVAWDGQEKLVGIKAADPNDATSFAVTVTKSGGFVIHSTDAIRMMGIGPRSTGFLQAEMKGEYLAASPFKKPEGIFAEVFAEDDGGSQTSNN